ncbi:hypothetical protein [Catenovulum sediminis]|uniref:MSHA biogenesis protein MshP n=1 Tax=Catenovulum sediminis TaxID=1740262 RepID=A0ABV1RCJ5_9ALTE|nr:hypothetical protein [Catenovulum sediminis]
MRHSDIHAPYRLKKQTGSSLVMALFVLVFLSVLLAGVMRSLNIAGMNNAYEIIGLRALAAAQSGLEISLSRLYPLNINTATDCATVTASAVNLPATNGFNNCQLNISCTTRSGVVNGADLLSITSLAQCTAGELTTSRQLTIEAVAL